MQVSEEEIQQNIEKLRNKIGDARTGGKGSQRRKVKVVSKNAVSHSSHREPVIKLSKIWWRKLAHNNLESMKSIFSEMTTLLCTLTGLKLMLPSRITHLLSLVNLKQKLLKIYSLILFSNWVPSNIRSLKTLYLVESSPPTKRCRP